MRVGRHLRPPRRLRMVNLTGKQRAPSFICALGGVRVSVSPDILPLAVPPAALRAHALVGGVTRDARYEIALVLDASLAGLEEALGEPGSHTRIRDLSLSTRKRGQ
eukprot:CAMPEP_0176306586 /NCGR_PEP_ID=MMETSP0121_2-20121125/63571_1 /TAXON_ID=160619 /ORGANISM="Kryptoperidinium foliaceum, Strain CCMP 1326" /LENGTH=105 /DNA_ID=CAMNT_0017648325 /DNA_START=135 /DNA_END=450 /DNA_ORIENTATION=+